MGLTSNIIPFSESKKFFSRITNDVFKKNEEKIITKNGRPYVAMISLENLDYYHKLKKDIIFSNLLDDMERGLDDVKHGRVYTLEQIKKKFKVK